MTSINDLKAIDWIPHLERKSNNFYISIFYKAYGKVTGIARIVLKMNKDIVFEKGDILITICSSPDFMPILKKAAGIIADEGGVTSHAAILSRELNIPCIIGTKTATRMLKDGDLVEVDAEKGTVKKL